VTTATKPNPKLQACAVCDARVKNPDHPKHIAGPKHQASLSGSQDVAAVPEWDELLNANLVELEMELSPDQFQRTKAELLRHVLFFRQYTWPGIRRELAETHSIVIPDAEEPHWIAPSGEILMWRELFFSVRRDVMNGDIVIGRRAAPESQGWKLHKLNGSNASIIAAAVKKGWRFRQDIEVVVDRQAAEGFLSGKTRAKVKVSEPERSYRCSRHIARLAAFPSWDGYVNHCVSAGEPVQETPPQEVIDQIAGSAFFCLNCSKSFINERGAAQHLSEVRKRGLGHLHTSVENMEVAG
jgi:hypothetical protein